MFLHHPLTRRMSWWWHGYYLVPPLHYLTSLCGFESAPGTLQREVVFFNLNIFTGTPAPEGCYFTLHLGQGVPGPFPICPDHHQDRLRS